MQNHVMRQNWPCFVNSACRVLRQIEPMASYFKLRHLWYWVHVWSLAHHQKPEFEEADYSPTLILINHKYSRSKARCAAMNLERQWQPRIIMCVQEYNCTSLTNDHCRWTTLYHFWKAGTLGWQQLLMCIGNIYGYSFSLFSFVQTGRMPVSSSKLPSLRSAFCLWWSSTHLSYVLSVKACWALLYVQGCAGGSLFILDLW